VRLVVLESGTMSHANPGASIAAGWAAIEGLFLSPGEQGGPTAADRFAAVVACSFARADIQTLAHWVAKQNSALGRQLKDLNSHDRASALETFISSGGTPSLRMSSDWAALARVRAMITNPESLRRVNTYFSSSIRRLYNQRNLIMHSGSFRSCALRATLRTTPPLVGAGLDRVAYSVLRAQGDGPVALAARAEIELSLLGKPGQRRLVDLLQ
jgi:hypothetical protein